MRHVGGIVAARIVKVLRGELDAKQRAKWWTEAREEVRQNALAMGCTHVVGYTETVATNEEEAVCVLSAVGTAVCLAADARSRCYAPHAHLTPRVLEMLAGARLAKDAAQARADERRGACRACHVPFARVQTLPFPAHLAPCCLCGRLLVPDFVLATA